jgi:hypothetical protein
MPRELTEEEVRDRLLAHVRGMVHYWEMIKLGPKEGLHERLEGLAFSMLVMLDGGSVDLPKFIVAPDPHPSDREYLASEGEDWYPENHSVVDTVKADLGGSLHEHFHKRPEPVKRSARKRSGGK